MANYIHVLRAKAEAAEAEVRALREQLNDFRIYLSTSPKFGNRDVLDADGLPTMPPAERMDWIATSDVLNRLRAIELAGLLAREESEQGG
jgi:hypothetical protein